MLEPGDPGGPPIPICWQHQSDVEVLTEPGRLREVVPWEQTTAGVDVVGGSHDRTVVQPPSAPASAGTRRALIGGTFLRRLRGQRIHHGARWRG